MGTSQALDELSAAKSQQAPIALVPENDEMVLVNGNFSVAKTDLYRANVGQAPVSWWTPDSTPGDVLPEHQQYQTQFLARNQALLATEASPVPGVGDNLFTFMANRLAMSFTNLDCQNFGLANPVTVTLDGDGAAIAATFNTTPQKVTNGGGGTSWPWHRWGARSTGCRTLRHLSRGRFRRLTRASGCPAGRDTSVPWRPGASRGALPAFLPGSLPRGCVVGRCGLQRRGRGVRRQ